MYEYRVLAVYGVTVMEQKIEEIAKEGFVFVSSFGHNNNYLLFQRDRDRMED